MGIKTRIKTREVKREDSGGSSYSRLSLSLSPITFTYDQSLFVCLFFFWCQRPFDAASVEIVVVMLFSIIELTR